MTGPGPNPEAEGGGALKLQCWRCILCLKNTMLSTPTTHWNSTAASTRPGYREEELEFYSVHRIPEYYLNVFVFQVHLCCRLTLP